MRIRKRLPRASQIAARRAFTLLELMIALSLTVFLMSVVYGIMDSYFQLTDLGRADAEQSQIARAVFDRLSVDLRSVVFEEIEEEEAEGEDAEGGTMFEPDLSLVNPDEAFAAGIIGLAGTASELVIQIARPTRAEALEAIAIEGREPDAPISELQVVSYMVAGQSGSTLGEFVFRDIPQDQFSAASDIGGLARVWGDALTIATAEEGTDPQALVQDFQLLAPEIISIQFTYLDAGEEQETWDSRELNRLPQAIAVEIGFRPPEPVDESDRSRPEFSEPSRFVRKVISLPMSEPYVDELAF